MKRFIAYWRRGAEHCNIVCTKIDVQDGIIFLWFDGDLIGQFDCGFVDAWYISEEKP